MHSLEEIARRRLHHVNGRFVSPFGGQRRFRFEQLVYWKLFTKNRYRHLYADERVIPVNVDWPAIRDHKGLSVTFIKHASLLIKDKGRHLVVDPLFGGMMPFKDFTPLAFNPQEIPSPDQILITHGHYDHLDRNTLAALGRSAHIISPLGYDDVFSSLGMNNRTRLDWLDVYENKNCRITLLPAKHWTMRSPIYGPNRSLWGSYLIETATGPTIYISGDTGFFDHFDEIGRKWKIDLAVFNLGAYEPRWFMAGSHMNPRETVRAFELLGAKRMMIVHWGTFRLGDEPVFLPPLDLAHELDAKGLKDRWIDAPHGRTIFAEEFS